MNNMADYTFDWREVYIIGNGPSRDRLLPDIPAGASVLAINDAVFRVRSLPCDPVWPVKANGYRVAVFSLDKDWVRRSKAFLASFHGERHVALPLETWPDCAGIPGVRYYGWSHAEGLSDDPAVIATGQNSGYGALGLAYSKGAKVIHLIGYDMDTPYMKQFWAPFFHHALPQLNAKGIKVINHNPDSAIDAFPKPGMTVIVDGVRRPICVHADGSMIFDYAPTGHPGAEGLPGDLCTS